MSSIRLNSRRRQEQGSKWSRIGIAILSTIGVIDTGSITLSKWGWLGALSCPGSIDGCDKVLNSPWGTLLIGSHFQIPLAFFGLISYLIVLTLAILPLTPWITENKIDLTRKTRWLLFLISCGMTIFSLILIGIMVVKIEAFCFFCILSAILSSLILLLALFGGGWEELGKIIFQGTMVSIAVLLGALIWSSSVDPSNQIIQANSQGVPPTVISQSSSSEISLAKHLTSKGIKMFSAYWCPHCHDQKEMFGLEASKELIIIECAIDGQDNQRSLCESKGVTGFPSWEINGEIQSGVKSLETLSNLSGYRGTKNFSNNF